MIKNSKIKIGRLSGTFIRDKWGCLTNCFWNKMIKQDIIKETKKSVILLNSRYG